MLPSEYGLGIAVAREPAVQASRCFEVQGSGFRNEVLFQTSWDNRCALV